MRELKTPARPGWYAPELIPGNRASREVEVLIAPLSAGTMDRLREREWGATREELLQDGPAQRAFHRLLRDEIVVEAVKDVRGYVAVDAETGERKEIRTGRELVDAITACDDPNELKVLDEIMVAARDASRLSEGLRRESKAPPEPSPPPLPPPQPGDAPDADGQTAPPSDTPKPPAPRPSAPKPSDERSETATA